MILLQSFEETECGLKRKCYIWVGSAFFCQDVSTTTSSQQQKTGISYLPSFPFVGATSSLCNRETRSRLRIGCHGPRGATWVTSPAIRGFRMFSQRPLLAVYWYWGNMFFYSGYCAITYFGIADVFFPWHKSPKAESKSHQPTVPSRALILGAQLAATWEEMPLATENAGFFWQLSKQHPLQSHLGCPYLRPFEMVTGTLQ